MVVKIVEEGGKRYAICPKCGAKVEKFPVYGKGPNPICPVCKKMISIREVPEEFIVHLPPRAKQKQEQKKDKDEGGGGIVKIKPPTPSAIQEKEEGLLKRPKEPHEVLEEILRQFGVKEEFIRFMVNRAKRLGPIHPADLVRFLLIMNSGVKKRDLANVIANEYSLALMAEQQKAKELGETYPTFFYQPQNTTASAPFFYPTPQSTTSQKPIYPPGQYPAQPGVYPPTQPFNPEALKHEILSSVQQMMQKLLVEKEEKKKVEMLEAELKRTREEMIKMQADFQQAIQNLVNQMTQQLQQLLAQNKNPAEDKIFQLQQMMIQQQVEFYQKLLEEKDKRVQELIQQIKEERGELTESIKAIINQYEKEREELLKKIEELKYQTMQPVSTEGFKTDEARVLATAITNLTNLLAQKRPVEIVVKSLPNILGPAPGERPQYIEVKEESKSKAVELLPEEYVVEE